MSKSDFQKDLEKLILFEQREIIEALANTLKPFAEAVFNDNGDITISYENLRREHFKAAYFMIKRLEEEEFI
ncbi:hypothetical protein D6827_00185 [Candidatus Parcubacteria bacterium]|nr:MAG: hypothetical protein D6827_00185 [Candidatus Parcubacteria bacterium]